MEFTLSQLAEGLRIFKRAFRVRKTGIKEYTGSAYEICHKIIQDCWNEKYFQISIKDGHFCEFFIRDFGWAIKPLLRLGYREKVIKTLEYALKKYSEQRLTTTITPAGKCVDIFRYSPDSIAYLIRCLKLSKAYHLIDTYNDFLKKEIDKCFKRCFDAKTSLVRADKYFGAMKDSAKRKSSTYDNVMIAMLSNDLNEIEFHNPFKKYDIKKAIKENLWNGKYFFDDLNKYPIVTGENNLFPYWTGVFQNKEMLKSSIQSIQEAELDKPFPLKYSSDKFKGLKKNLTKLFVPNYQSNSIKMHMGALYIQMLKKIDFEKANAHIAAYKNLIEQYKTYLEGFYPDGTPFRTFFYYSDEGNLWCANYLTL